jgi:hypothetical protein
MGMKLTVIFETGCNSVQAASSDAASKLLGLLGVVVQDLNVLVGITCTPITVIGAGGNSCSTQTVCCENNNFSKNLLILFVIDPLIFFCRRCC